MENDWIQFHMPMLPSDGGSYADGQSINGNECVPTGRWKNERGEEADVRLFFASKQDNDYHCARRVGRS